MAAMKIDDQLHNILLIIVIASQSDMYDMIIS